MPPTITPQRERQLINRMLAGVVVTAAVALTGCGGSGGVSRAAFKAGFATSQKQFRQLGTTLASDITGARAKTDAALASEFATLAARARRQAADLAKLKAPAQYDGRINGLVAGFHSLAADLTQISDAATKHDAKTAAAAVKTLFTDATKIKAADAGLSKSLGLASR
jgi:hypothetical protein